MFNHIDHIFPLVVWDNKVVLCNKQNHFIISYKEERIDRGRESPEKKEQPQIDAHICIYIHTHTYIQIKSQLTRQIKKYNYYM